MGTFGDTLRQARTVLSASLADAERETHIQRRYLEALEEEDHGALPATVYTRGFIRTYCRYLGLNPDAMLDLFGRRQAEGERPRIRPTAVQAATPRAISFRPVAVLGLLVLAGVLATYLWTQYTSFVDSIGRVEQVPTSRSAATPTAPPKPTAVAAPVELPTPTVEVATPEPLPVVASPTPEPTVPRALVVEARIVQRTWLEVWVDGRSQVAETVQPGSNRTFTGQQQVKMRVGNAAGVQILVNGISQGPLGAQGEAVDATWGRQ